MKKLIILLSCLFVLALSLPTLAELSAADLIKKHEANLPKSIIGKMEMRICRPDAEDHVSVFDIWVKGKDKSLIRYTSPAREKGTGCLKLKDEMYFYVPRTSKVMKIAGRQQLMGSDFSMSDVMGLDLSTGYTYALADPVTINKVEHYVVVLKAKTRDAVYAMIKVYLRKDNFQTTKQELYTSSGKLLRTLLYEDYKEMDKRVTATKITMTNALAEGNYTVMLIKEARYDQNIPDYIFTISNLQRVE